MTTNGYVISTVNNMRDDLTKPVDITGQYGPQSVDLIIHYVRELTGVKWAGPTQHARDLMIAPGLRIWFDAVDPDSARYGDIVVLHGFDTSDFGTTGVFLQDFTETHFEIFSQTPHYPQANLMLRESIVGVLRYKYVGPINKTNVLHEPYSIDRLWTPGNDEPHPLREAFLKDTPAEKRAVLGEFMVKDDEELTDGEWCVKQYDKYAADVLDDFVKRGERESARRAALWGFKPGVVESDTVQPNLDELNQPGDIIVWDSDVANAYGHIAIVQNAPAPWWRRLTNWLGITRPQTMVAVQQKQEEE
ncbi:hypothetical protein SEA_GREKAYCON_64 [Arthrobacter phage Grekaycon]|uniref:Uncharacterized protein n=1 Tax=Arthrobacter phage Grekaycon TaxID=2591068 RepID=A0A514A5L4_9CAUD|nr:hypothetical protein SEA_GREKAYCON_64 [Arthrobacter phage Grekaycon]